MYSILYISWELVISSITPKTKVFLFFNISFWTINSSIYKDDLSEFGRENKKYLGCSFEKEKLSNIISCLFSVLLSFWLFISDNFFMISNKSFQFNKVK